MRRNIQLTAISPRITGSLCVLLAALALFFLADKSSDMTAGLQSGIAPTCTSVEYARIVLPETNDLVYLMQVDNPERCLSIPSLSLNTEEKTFQLFLSPLSSYLIFGSYEVKGDLLTALTLDHSYCYRFRIEDESTLVYVSGPAASAVGVPDESLSPSLKYGCRFLLSSAEDGSSDEKPTEIAGRNAIHDLDQAVGLAVLSFNHGRFVQTECMAEGHLILEEDKETNDTVTVYALTMYGEYQFQDNAFIKAAGSGVIPTVFLFSYSEKHGYVLKSCEVPADGSGYIESIQELFPEHLWDVCITPDDETCDALREQEQSYASRYLQQIGRTADIGRYGDFPRTLLTDVGVSVEVSNLMCAYDRYDELWKYPYWIGHIEYLEDGVRYVYAMSYDDAENEIVYTKSLYDDGTVVQTHVFDSLTGKKKR